MSGQKTTPPHYSREPPSKPEGQREPSMFPRSFNIYSGIVRGKASRSSMFKHLHSDKVIGTSATNRLFYAFMLGPLVQLHAGPSGIATPVLASAIKRSVASSAQITLDRFLPQELYASPTCNYYLRASRGFIGFSRRWYFDFHHVPTTGRKETFVWWRFHGTRGGFDSEWQLTQKSTGEVIAVFKFCPRAAWGRNKSKLPEAKFEFVSKAALGEKLELMVVISMLFVCFGRQRRVGRDGS